MTKDYYKFYERFLESTMNRPRATLIKTNVNEGKIEKMFLNIIKEAKDGKEKALHLMKRVWDGGESYVVSFEPCYTYTCQLDGMQREVSCATFVKNDDGFAMYESGCDGSIWNHEPIETFDTDDLVDALSELGYKYEKSPQFSTMTISDGGEEDTGTPVPHDEEG